MMIAPSLCFWRSTRLTIGPTVSLKLNRSKQSQEHYLIGRHPTSARKIYRKHGKKNFLLFSMIDIPEAFGVCVLFMIVGSPFLVLGLVLLICPKPPAARTRTAPLP